VCPRSERKTTRAIKTKFGTHIFYGRTPTCIDPESKKKSKVKFTRLSKRATGVVDMTGMVSSYVNFTERYSCTLFLSRARVTRHCCKAISVIQLCDRLEPGAFSAIPSLSSAIGAPTGAVLAHSPWDGNCITGLRKEGVVTEKNRLAIMFKIYSF